MLNYHWSLWNGFEVGFIQITTSNRLSKYKSFCPDDRLILVFSNCILKTRIEGSMSILNC